ncbi:MAG: DDE-type integrase/transposase/recombinase [Janthinobacterium lividum]
MGALIHIIEDFNSDYRENFRYLVLLARPDRVTTDGHGSYPRAIRTVLGKVVRHRTSAYLNNRPEQDHSGIKGRIRCMRGFKSHDAAHRFCREHGELRDLLRLRRRHNQPVPPPSTASGSQEAPALRSGSCSMHDPESV